MLVKLYPPKEYNILDNLKKNIAKIYNIVNMGYICTLVWHAREANKRKMVPLWHIGRGQFLPYNSLLVFLIIVTVILFSRFSSYKILVMKTSHGKLIWITQVNSGTPDKDNSGNKEEVLWGPYNTKEKALGCTCQAGPVKQGPCRAPIQCKPGLSWPQNNKSARVIKVWAMQASPMKLERCSDLNHHLSTPEPKPLQRPSPANPHQGKGPTRILLLSIPGSEQRLLPVHLSLRSEPCSRTHYGGKILWLRLPPSIKHISWPH